MDKRWLEQYQENVPYQIDTEQYSSLLAFFQESCTHYAKRVAYSNFGIDLTYQQLNQLSRDLAAYLQQLNLKKGARIALMMPNLLQYPIALFAILRAGHVVVNTNPLYTSDEIVHQLNDCGAEMIIVLANFAHTVEKALPQIPTVKHVIITQLGDLFPIFRRVVVNLGIKYIKKLITNFNIPHAVSYRYALLEGQQAPLHQVKLNQDDIAFLQYTGGTTGISKGAMLTHGNMLANIEQAYVWIAPLGVGCHDIIITALPLYHIFSLTANCLTFLKVGAKNILITNPRDLDRLIETIKNTQFTAITGVNTLYNALLNHPRFKEIDFSHLKLALAGGMALQKSVSLQWSKLTNTPILEAYGLTETSPAAVMNPMYLEEYNGSIGIPISSTEVSIRDNEGKEVPIGSSGELCIKGPQVMKGYWNHPEENALVFTPDNFFKTGDIARMDEEGFIYLIDRKKDMIVVSGFNVYPNELEQVIGMHPGVLEVGVVGIADEESGERVKACIVKKDPSLTEEQIIAYCREHLTAYKVPKVVAFFDELPKTNVGKILRRALKEPKYTEDIKGKKALSLN